jgi:hypothetical protein
LNHFALWRWRGRQDAPLRDYLTNHIRSGDRLLVTKYGKQAAWFGFSQKASDWLNDNL